MSLTDALTAVALIPARSGSVRVKHKNIRKLGGVPLIAYTIKAALDSGVFDKVVCATDSMEYAQIAKAYGAEVPFLRPAEISGSNSPDITWVKFMLEELARSDFNADIFSILRPTSPFRRPETIRRAFRQFTIAGVVDSLRAVEPCKEHPGKMWTAFGDIITPLMPFSLGGVPWHSNQKASLPEVLVQNASLEIAWSRVVQKSHSISGAVVIPFYTENLEGFDINDEVDWIVAEHYCAKFAPATDWFHEQKN